MLIVFDIDGTLADLTHRLHHIKGEGPKDWDAFFAATRFDKTIPEMITLCINLIEIGNDVIFASGRNEICRADTILWLSQHAQLSTGYIDRMLYMRSEGDRRPDYLVKHDILVKIMTDWGQKPDIVFDDRQQVVDMWRDEGIRCCQVAPGNF